MKKFLLILTILAMAVSLSACGDKEAYDFYSDMEAAMAKVKSTEMAINGVVDMVAGGQTINMKLNGTVKEVIRSDIDIDMEMNMSIDMMGQTIDTKSFYTDGYMYQEVMGQKIKTAVPIEEAVAQAGSLENFKFAKEAVKSSSITDVDGGRQLDFELDPAVVTDMLSGLTSSMTDSMGIADTDMTFSNIKYSVIADKDNMMKSCHIIFGLDLNIEGQTINAQYDMSMDAISYDKFDKIDMPTDLSEYQEM